MEGKTAKGKTKEKEGESREGEKGTGWLEGVTRNGFLEGRELLLPYHLRTQKPPRVQKSRGVLGGPRSLFLSPMGTWGSETQQAAGAWSPRPERVVPMWPLEFLAHNFSQPQVLPKL